MCTVCTKWHDSMFKLVCDPLKWHIPNPLILCTVIIWRFVRLYHTDVIWGDVTFIWGKLGVLQVAACSLNLWVMQLEVCQEILQNLHVHFLLLTSNWLVAGMEVGYCCFLQQRKVDDVITINVQTVGALLTKGLAIARYYGTVGNDFDKTVCILTGFVTFCGRTFLHTAYISVLPHLYADIGFFGIPQELIPNWNNRDVW